MKLSPSPPQTANYRLSASGFALPLLFLLCATFLQNTPIETVATWGLGLCLLASPFALGALFFRIPPVIKHALSSFLVGFVLTGVLFVWAAYIAISGAQSHG